jgi:hypothetical protein
MRTAAELLQADFHDMKANFGASRALCMESLR